MNMIKKKYIYDIKMANFYMLQGVRCLGTGIHKVTKNIFWCFPFEESEEAYCKWIKLCENLKRD